ncbi:hypothetical protein THOM_2899 [Trachipleistophora hominis]|uniref:Uncharacterized protein n=1 Tax=Trachipleistophora hominis TaxID=72359 RepID=L7JT46_TRAHO|nr:hypothetical protein THOM_2899 [Trachipleistophora hominis]
MSSFPLDSTFLTKDVENDRKLTMEDVEVEYEKIREQMYKEMEIEKVQNNIYQKLYNKMKSNSFSFERIQKQDKRSLQPKNDQYTITESPKMSNMGNDGIEMVDKVKQDAYTGSEGIVGTIVESEIDDESDIVDLNNITDSEEGVTQQDPYKSKYLDVEAEEGSTGSEVDVPYDNFDYAKDIKRQDDIIKRLEKRYLRKKKVEKLEPLFKVEDVSSSEENLEFVNLSTDNIECNIVKDEDSVECVENEKGRDLNEYMVDEDINPYGLMNLSRNKRK